MAPQQLENSGGVARSATKQACVSDRTDLYKFSADYLKIFSFLKQQLLRLRKNIIFLAAHNSDIF